MVVVPRWWLLRILFLLVVSRGTFRCGAVVRVVLVRTLFTHRRLSSFGCGGCWVGGLVVRHRYWKEGRPRGPHENFWHSL